MSTPPPVAGRGHLLAFAGLSASYFAHIGFFNPYLPLWLKDLGLPIFTISLLASVQSVTRVFAPYAWGALSDHTGQRVLLLRISAAIALLSSFGLWWNGGAWWLALVLLLMFTHTSSMMSLTEAAMAHLVAGDWGRYGRIRLCGSAGFLVTVFVAGEWFDRFGMKHFPAWAAGTLAVVLLATLRLPDSREPVAAHDAPGEPIGPVLRNRVVQWFFAALFFQVMSHFSVYAFFSLYLDSLGYGKSTIGLLWALSVVAEIVWFFLQGRLIGLLPMPRWMLVCGIAAVARLGLTAGLGGWIAALVVAQWLHALSFAAHHTTCIAVVSRRFPGRLRGRGQALFTVIGYGFGGVLGVLLGGAVAQAFGYRTMFALAALLAVAGTLCAWKVMRLEAGARRAASPA
ncbi:MFS transporter [Variovorax paradoxus]|uniref:MFS transporter n=1 Tax=Variovorax TaxID=34072 RepID=UPI0006E6134B|nr:MULTISPECIES: MFS transporter [unclassified Variovorax]KPU88138.1 MFS transporter [Variovorax paradoxus]KPU89075.1 MFS transporter [Variovorax paradoxus]KPU96916.1 MFS transporter [Variovorax paradoxus]KPV14835.1 MFS transporter [Variovorax paradoxus]KPV15200.1 MFS transporter [Variovorax paradoxus]